MNQFKIQLNNNKTLHTTKIVSNDKIKSLKDVKHHGLFKIRESQQSFCEIANT